MDFFEQRRGMAKRNFSDPGCRAAVRQWHDASRAFDYQYMFEWLGRPIIQDPQDICAIQELIWRVQPDLIVETGIAHGGSLVLSASILAAIVQGESLAGRTPRPRRVVGIDIDIRAHNRAAIERHPLFPMITLIEGSSVSEPVLGQVRAIAGLGDLRAGHRDRVRAAGVVQRPAPLGARQQPADGGRRVPRVPAGTRLRQGPLDRGADAAHLRAAGPAGALVNGRSGVRGGAATR
jgi:hypothetical protein